MPLRPNSVKTLYMIGGDRLRQLQEESGLTQQEIADRIGTSQQQIARWLKANEAAIPAEQWRSLQEIQSAIESRQNKNDRS